MNDEATSFWAHSDPTGLRVDDPGSRAQPLGEHLANVSHLAGLLASAALPGDEAFQQMARSAGMLHDLGKFTPCFQGKITDPARRNKRCPHAIYGALAALEDPSGGKRPRAYPVAAAIAAHHGGLADARGFQEQLRSAEGYAHERQGLIDFWRAAIADQPGIPGALASIPQPASKRADLLVRMLLSCLVDADRLDTAHRSHGEKPLEAAALLDRLEQHMLDVARAAAGRGTPEPVLAAREAVQQACRRAASWPEKLLSLSVPTGGGKTLAAMRFALERAALQPSQYRRVIVVIPFLSIIEQNAKVYREIFGDDAVLEHHSGAMARLKAQPTAPGEDQYYVAVDEDESAPADPALALRRAAVENWDAPLVVTTSVRFFESLFSNHPSDLRRVHNIARSIIVLDEVQTLPRRLLAPLLAMLRELTEDWGCTVVMTPATQPAFEQHSTGAPACLWPKGSVREIMDDPPALHRALERVRLEWRLDRPTPWPELAAELGSHPQVLCVVNLREHAAMLFGLLREAVGDRERESIFHLSTRMCAQHRLDVLARVRARLEAGEPCRVVSTQLIEAGVDVDFPIAYRALGPLDAIIQVAGRVDREGKATARAGAPAGRLVVFQTEDGKTPPNDYKEATGVTAALAGSREIQPGDLEAMRRYFERFYGDPEERSLGTELAGMRGNGELKFRTLADQFEMINSRMRDVFVHYGAGKALLDELMAARYMDWRLLRRLQRYSVGLQPWEFDAARQSGTIVELSPESDVWLSSSAAYDDEIGQLARQDERKLIV